MSTLGNLLRRTHKHHVESHSICSCIYFNISFFSSNRSSKVCRQNKTMLLLHQLATFGQGTLSDWSMHMSPSTVPGVPLSAHFCVDPPIESISQVLFDRVHTCIYYLCDTLDETNVVKGDGCCRSYRRSISTDMVNMGSPTSEMRLERSPNGKYTGGTSVNEHKAQAKVGTLVLSTTIGKFPFCL